MYYTFGERELIIIYVCVIINSYFWIIFMNEENLVGISNRIRQIKDEKNLSLTEFCKVLDLPTSTVFNYLSAKRSPDIKFLDAFHCYFKVDLNWVITGEGYPYKENHEKTLDDKEIKLIESFRSLNNEIKNHFFQLIIKFNKKG